MTSSFHTKSYSAACNIYEHRNNEGVFTTCIQSRVIHFKMLPLLGIEDQIFQTYNQGTLNKCTMINMSSIYKMGFGQFNQIIFCNTYMIMIISNQGTEQVLNMVHINHHKPC